MDSLTLKHHISFQSKNNRKPVQSFAPRPLIFKFENSMISDESDLPKNWPGDELFKLRKSKF